jgi:metallo-beta-lactamase class B
MATNTAPASTSLTFSEEVRAFVPGWLVFAIVAAASAQIPAVQCSRCAEWNRPQKPLRIYGNTYYVGPHGLSAILITSDAGHILIDAALPQSAPLIAANIRSLGFRIEDVKIILNSHVHFDHAGGIADLQRLSRAKVVASPWSAAVMRTGGPGPGDPQYVGGEKIATVDEVQELHDGERLTVGPLAVVAHFTPGHTPGGTSWTWQSCEHDVCRDIVYADSLTPVSSDGFRFTDSKEYPHAVDDFEKSFKFLETTPCAILITTHPEVSALWDRLEGREKAVTPNPMVDAGACRRLAQNGRESLRQRLAEERRK